MAKHKFEMTVCAYSTVQFEIDLDGDNLDVIQFYLEHSENLTWKGLRDLLPDDLVLEIDLAGQNSKTTFNYHEISLNHSFDFD